MRVTNSMMVTGLMNNLESNLNRMSRKQDELASGKRVLRASDNPIEASKILKYKTDLSELDQFGRNTNDALSWLEVTESSIADSGLVLQRMRELAVQAANGTNATEDTQKISKEIESLRKQLISNGNFNFAGRYVFSGTQTDQPLFNDDGTFNINVTNADLVSPQNTLYNIGIGEQIEVNTPGIDVYGYAPLNTTMTQTYPDGLDTGTAATKAVISTGLNTGVNLTTGVNDDATVIITVNGTAYTLDNTVQLPVTNRKLTDLNGTSGSPIDPSDILNLIKLAKNGGATLDSVADVYFNGAGELTIKSKTYGTATSSVVVSFTGDTGVGLTVADLENAFGGLTSGSSDTGTDITNASLIGPSGLTDATIAGNITELEGTSFTLSLNGVQKTITLGAGTIAPPTQGGLTSALNAAFNSAFGVGQVVATFGAGDKLTVTTANQPNNGTAPSLEMRITRATESSLIADVDDLIVALNSGDYSGMSAFIGKVDSHLNRVLSVRADIGARVNRMDLIMNRITDNSVSFTKMLSNSQDADMAEVIMNLKNAENVYKSALSVGARVIQPSLIDFVR